MLLTALLVRQGRWIPAGAVGAVTVGSPVLLLLQQQGEDIGAYQLTWLTALCAPLLVLALALVPDGPT